MNINIHDEFISLRHLFCYVCRSDTILKKKQQSRWDCFSRLQPAYASIYRIRIDRSLLVFAARCKSCRLISFYFFSFSIRTWLTSSTPVESELTFRRDRPPQIASLFLTRPAWTVMFLFPFFLFLDCRTKRGKKKGERILETRNNTKFRLLARCSSYIFGDND